MGRFRDQTQRLFGATIAFNWDMRTAGEWHDYLASYKIAFIVLNLVPYVSLELIA